MSLLRIIAVPVSFIRQLRNADLILHDEIAASFVPYGQLFSSPQLPPPQCCVVVDSGFSFTHVIPMVNGEIIWKAVKR
jgi:hypothetical protein